MERVVSPVLQRYPFAVAVIKTTESPSQNSVDDMGVMLTFGREFLVVEIVLLESEQPLLSVTVT
jgi:hypothetical protein